MSINFDSVKITDKFPFIQFVTEKYPINFCNMDAKTAETIVEKLRKELSKRGLQVADLEEQIGIPRDRAYKWLKNIGKPKAEDAAKIEQWISGKTEIFPERESSGPDDFKDALIRMTLSMDKLADAMKLDAETRNIEAVTRSRLVKLLEEKHGGDTFDINNLPEGMSRMKKAPVKEAKS